MPVRKSPGYYERKLIAGALAGTLFFLLLVFIQPLPIDTPASGWSNSLQRFTNAIPVYMMYITPVAIIYFVLTSLISDRAARYLTRRKNGHNEWLFSLIFHLIFGLILFWYTLAAALFFFVIDRMLKKWRDRYSYKHVLLAMVVPFFTWFIFMMIAFLKG
ncbi:hypothetical protein L2D08_10505 [Domibacillus sp. PGB-M46]|uniref:hypothetical protein n=1 Tax=Domibacillus sp. PGB-M46 TaxID=2910255 RepID=UPI001F564FC7|nr:hypothetical protein [Domibacillus sp. PGB-M46]MCI2254795.1 hypothetical protein [Domibacillus sp. PGB-M46]